MKLVKRHNYLNQYQMGNVTRANALFYVKTSTIHDTVIFFLEYWSIKHSVNSINLKIIIWDTEGQKIHSLSSSLSKKKAYRFSIKEILIKNKKNVCFEGSVLFIIDVDKDIRFSYPALHCVYYALNSQAMVHTYTRLLHRRCGDNKKETKEEYTAQETNWPIYSGKNLRHFIIIHSGGIPLKEGVIKVKILSASGKSEIKKFIVSKRKKFSLLKIVLEDQMDVKKVVAKSRGIGVVTYQNAGVFPRILAGVENSKGEILNVTHSHHNSKNEEVFSIDKKTKPFFITLPLGPDEIKFKNLLIYPTTRNGSYQIICRGINSQNRINCYKKLAYAVDGKNKIKDLSKVFLEFKKKGSKLLDVEIVPQKDKAPTRIHAGVNFGNAILTTGFASQIKPRYSSYWFPIFSDVSISQLLFFIHTNSFYKDEHYKTDFPFTIYREGDSKTLKGKVSININGCLQGNPFKLFKKSKQFLRGRSGWCMLRSSTPVNCHLFFLIKNKESGIVAAEHGY